MTEKTYSGGKGVQHISFDEFGRYDSAEIISDDQLDEIGGADGDLNVVCPNVGIACNPNPNIVNCNCPPPPPPAPPPPPDGEDGDSA